mgnify:CR=1 FL=1
MNTWYSETVHGVPYERIGDFYRHVQAQGPEAIQWLVLRDRYFLLTCVLGRKDAANRWCFDRCREVERDTDGFLDLWSRFHYKSTIITLAGAIQEILRDPDVTIGILSYNKRLAEKFVDQIRRELENPVLTGLFPDILWERPPKINWSTQNGLIVKRRSNPKEPTVSGSGLVDGQPIGAHFKLRIYDDIVVPASVSSPEQIRKTTEAWELSLALGTSDGGRAWYAGTRYHQADTYSEMIRREAIRERRRLCEDADGNPTMMTREALDEIRRTMGPAMYAAQMLQAPAGTGTRTFKDDWWNVCLTAPQRRTMRVAILIDSANAKKKCNDFTTMWAVGWGQDRNHYLLDGVHDRLNLQERTDALFGLVEIWEPEAVFWEQIGAMSDTQHVRYVQDQRGWHFPIVEMHQKVPKHDRIRWLQPTFEAGRLWVPAKMLRRQIDGETRDLMRDLFDDEYAAHPVCRHDDMLDDLANIHHPEVEKRMGFPRRQDLGQQPQMPKNHSWNPLARY